MMFQLTTKNISTENFRSHNLEQSSRYTTNSQTLTLLIFYDSVYQEMSQLCQTGQDTPRERKTFEI